MRYRITLLDSARSPIAVMTGLTSAILSEKINGCGILTIETTAQSLWPLITPGTCFLSVTDVRRDTTDTFRVLETDTVRDHERRSLRIVARHVLYDTAAEVVGEVLTCVRYTPAQLMSAILAHSVYAPGSIEPTVSIPFVRFEFDTVFSCLERLTALTGGEMRLNESTGVIDLVDRIGTDNGAVFRYGVNLKKASRRISMSRMANRVYGIGGGDPPLLLDSAAASGGSRYAEDSASIAAYGLFESVCHEPTLEPVDNLIATPAFDGNYTDGLCEDWTATGSPTVSENTDTANILYGTASQRVQAGASGDGISQVVPVTPGTIYSLSATVFITSGSVRINISDGDAEYRREAPVTGTGFVRVDIENWKANTASVTVAISQEGTATADFSLDSVQLAAGAHSLPFTVGSSADTLWDRTVEVLDARKNPDIIYDIGLVDRSDEPGGEHDRFGLGDSVRVIDPSLGFDVHTRVMERSIDLLKPWRVNVRLDNTTSTLADVLAVLRDAQQAGIRYQRASYAAGSNAAEAGSSRLGFSSLAFRFFGEVAPVAWNSVSWTAGTFRAGVGYYQIAAGSFTDLPASSTRYVYFDRTAPGTFSMTGDPAEAETEDRILVFAITTTTAPNLPGIHPLGVIHS